MLVNLRAVLARLVDILLLRGGPENLPTSWGLLVVVVVLKVAVSALAFSLVPKAPNDWQTSVVVEALVFLLGIRVTIALANKPERFLQTATAIFGTTIFFEPAMIPMGTALLPYVLKPDPAVPPPAALTLLATVVVVWYLVVQVRILSAAFEWHWVVALVYFVALNFCAALVYAMVFGVPPNAA